jgi:carbonic anhydrase/acetyltransferase-like protein (isoleucine patch superfamily)
MVMGLTVQFLLGMAVNLIGQPAQTTGDARIASTVFLATHALVSVGMVIGAGQAVRAAAYLGGPWRSRRSGVRPPSLPP